MQSTVFLRNQAGSDSPSGPAPVEDFNFKISFRITPGVMITSQIPESLTATLDLNSGSWPFS